MNKTVTFLGLAGGLALVAVLLGLPNKGETATAVDPPNPTTAATTTASTGQGALSLTARLSHPLVATTGQEVFITSELTAMSVPGAQRSPVNLALVLDRSGSMSGYKLEQAKQAARHLIAQLGAQDRLSIVHYGSDVRAHVSVLADPQRKADLLAYVEGIYDEGGTNIGAGLEAGLYQVRPYLNQFKVNRVVLISDGQATEGITDDAALAQKARELRQAGVTVSALGVGTDFNEDLMQLLAELGSGSYGFMQDAAQLTAIFAKDLQQAATTVARGVELSFELPEGVALQEVLGYRFTQQGNTVRIPLPDFASGQVERVVARVSVPAATSGSAVPVGGVSVRYGDLLQDGRAIQTAVALQAVASAQQDQVLARRDKDAFVLATQAQGAQNLQRAAEYFKKGQRQQAQAYLEKNQALYDDAEKDLGPAPAIQERRAEVITIIRGMSEASSPEAVESEVKNAKVKALKSFGRGSSVY